MEFFTREICVCVHLTQTRDAQRACAGMENKMLELKKICKNYNPGSVNELCLFKDFSFTVQDGEFVSVVGSNGSG